MYVRVRPLNDAERERGAAWRVESNGILQVDPASGEPRSDTPYKLDAVFGGGQPTAAVYEATTQGLIHQVVNGFNSTVFAYGQVRAGRARWPGAHIVAWPLGAPMSCHHRGARPPQISSWCSNRGGDPKRLHTTPHAGHRYPPRRPRLARRTP